MKPCLICHAENPDHAASCHACGEGSFGEPVATKSEPKRPAREPEGVTLPAAGRSGRPRR